MISACFFCAYISFTNTYKDITRETNETIMYLRNAKTGVHMASELVTILEYLIGGAVGSFIIAEIMNYFNNRSADQTFVNLGKEMAETTVVGVQALQDISTMAISSLVGVSGVNDVNNLVKKKVEEQKAS